MNGEQTRCEENLQTVDYEHWRAICGS